MFLEHRWHHCTAALNIYLMCTNNLLQWWHIRRARWNYLARESLFYGARRAKIAGRSSEDMWSWNKISDIFLKTGYKRLSPAEWEHCRDEISRLITSWIDSFSLPCGKFIPCQLCRMQPSPLFHSRRSEREWRLHCHRTWSTLSSFCWRLLETSLVKES